MTLNNKISGVCTRLLFAMSVFSFSISSCSKEEPKEISNFKIIGSSEAREDIADIFNISLIPIETNDSAIINLESAMYNFDGDTIIIYDWKTDCFYIFDKGGNFISRLNRKGQSREEYAAVHRFRAKDGKLHIYYPNKIKSYDYKGNYLGDMDVQDLSRGDFAITDDGDFYVRKTYIYPYQLVLLNKDGSEAAAMLPPNEKMMSSPIPAGPEYHAIGELGNGLFATVPMDQNIYYIEDSTLTVLATFDFGADNIPGDYFDQPDEIVYNKFWDRRNRSNGNGGFVYFDYLFINDNWIVFCPVGVEDKLIIADRRTGKAYSNNDFPEVVKKLLGKSKTYIRDYDRASESFSVSMTSYDLKTLIEELSESGELEKYPELYAIDPESINEDDNGYIILLNLK